jgi:RimJ/RimL family protein N-acetyltransferase
MPVPDRETTSLSDSVITIRPVQLEDAEPWFEAVQETLNDLRPWMSFVQQESGREYPSRQDIVHWLGIQVESWAKGANYAFAIMDANTGALLGSCLLNGLNPLYRMANVVYWVRTNARGRGTAGRAVRLLARFGFHELGLLRLEIVVATVNQVSQRVAEKAGARREGVLRNRILVGEILYEAVMYSLIPDDLL